MRAVIQRVTRADVSVEGEVVGKIGAGVVALVGVAQSDGEQAARAMAKKICELRIFPDEQGKMNRSLADAGGSVLVVSQFTLLGDTSRGRRPSFVHAAAPETAEPLINRVIEEISASGIPVAQGRFRADMQVSLTNDGPVTLVIET